MNQSDRNLKDWVRPWFCGLTSGIVDMVVTFPLNKLMFRQQLGGISPDQAIRQFNGEMKRMRFFSKTMHVYRGVLPPTFHRCLGRMLTFGGFDFCHEVLSKSTSLDGEKLRFAAALCSGCFEGLICCPFERIQTILQDSANNQKFINSSDVLRQLSVREYYRGIRPILLRNGPSTFLYFHMYHISSGWVCTGYADEFVRGAMGGMLATTYGFIFNVIKSRQQSILDPAESKLFSSSFHTLKMIYAERGGSIRQLYCGLPVALMRTSLGWGIATLWYQKSFEYCSSVS